MSTFALIHGAWGSGWHWASVPDELRRMGHVVVVPDLPCDEEDAAFDDYAQVVLDALDAAGAEDVVVVGYSIGGHTAAVVAARRPARELVYVAALVPEPGLSITDQFVRGERLVLPDYLAGLEGVGADGLNRWVDFDVYHRVGCHDCPEPVARERFDRSRPQSNRVFGVPCSLTEPPDVPTRYILCTEDRITNNAYWREAVPARLGTDPIELPGSHSPMASRPADLAALLAASA
jgi:pimeloyl-ACP methyl ester carboxylesterase